MNCGGDLMFRQVLIGVLALSLAAVAAPASASGAAGNIKFSDLEISAIRAYYRDQGSSRPGANPRGMGRKSLPPGIARNLQRGKSLPPGIAKQVLPARLTQVLPAAPKGFERVVIDGKILLVEIATQVIHDVLEDAILD